MLRRSIVLACVLGCAVMWGCEAAPKPTEPVKPTEPAVDTPVVTTPAAKPELPKPPKKEETRPEPPWVQQLGAWVDDWQLAESKKGRSKEWIEKWEWVAGTSKPVGGLAHDALARQSASQDAVFHLMRLLGMDFNSQAKTGVVWSSVKTGQVVDGLYRAALTEELFKAKVNFKEFANYGYTVDESGGALKHYVVKVLYRLDMAKFGEQNVLQKAKEKFLKDVAKVKELTEAEREKAKNAAEKLVQDAVKSNPLLRGTK